MTTTASPAEPAAFPSQATTFLLPGPVGPIEVAVDVPDPADAVMGTAVLCHPHPLHGCTMENKVVTITERSFRELGLRTVRFNFRGVGASAGVHDDGNGEMDDLLAVCAWVERVRPHDALWLAGFSFGSFVAANAGSHLPKLEQLVLIAPPVAKYPYAALPNPVAPWLVLQGEDDDVAPPQPVVEWVRSLADPPQLVLMPGAGHFFHRKLMDLRGALKNAVRSNLPPPENATA
jgi:uncharacterized protein